MAQWMQSFYRNGLPCLLHRITRRTAADHRERQQSYANAWLLPAAFVPDWMAAIGLPNSSKPDRLGSKMLASTTSRQIGRRKNEWRGKKAKKR